METSNNPRDLVFQIPMVWDKLFNYLTLEDQKALRATSPLINEQLTSHSRFHKNWLHINNASFSLPNFGELLVLCPLYKNVKITLVASNPEETSALKYFETFLENTECLQLEWDQSKQNLFNFEEIQRSVFRLISYCSSNLSTLRIEDALLGVINLSQVDYKVRSHFDHLTSFEILHALPGKVIGNHKEYFASSVEFLQDVLANLVSFEVDDFEVYDSVSEPSIYGFIPKILTKNCTSLEQVRIRNAKAAYLCDMKSVTLPKLTKLSLRKIEKFSPDDSELDEHIISTFLGNNVQATKLELLELSISGSLTKDLYDSVRKCGSTLKTLSIKVKAFDSIGLEDNTWNYLSTLNQLADFSLIIPTSFRNTESIGSIHKILSYLPSNICTIYLRGNPTPNSLNRVLDFSEFNWPKLRQLSIMRWGNVINDATLEYIGSRSITTGHYPFPRLVKFEVSHCYTISSFGTGEFWRGLIYLSIRRCSSLSGNILAPVLQASNLRQLDVSCNPRSMFQLQHIQQIVSGNRRLEKLRCSHYGVQPEGRLSKVEYIDFDNDDSDSDSDAECVMQGYGEGGAYFDDDQTESEDDSRDHYGYDDTASQCDLFHNFDYSGTCQNCGEYDYEYDEER